MRIFFSADRNNAKQAVLPINIQLRRNKRMEQQRGLSGRQKARKLFSAVANAASLSIMLGVAAHFGHSAATRWQQSSHVRKYFSELSQRKSSEPKRIFDKWKPFFQSHGIAMPPFEQSSKPAPATQGGEYFAHKGLVFENHESWEDIFNEKKKKNIAKALRLLERTKSPMGGSWLEFVKTIGEIISVKQLPSDRYGELEGAGPVEPEFEFDARVTEKEAKELFTNPRRPFSSVWKRGGKGNAVNLRIGIRHGNLAAKNNGVSDLMRGLNGKIRFHHFSAPHLYADINISDRHVEDAKPVELAKTLVHEAAHALFRRMRPKKAEQPGFLKETELLAFTAASMFINDAVRQGHLPKKAWLDNEAYIADRLASVRSGAYHRKRK